MTPLHCHMVEELLGADYSVHNILHGGIGIEEAVEILKDFHEVTEGLDPTGNNLGETCSI